MPIERPTFHESWYRVEKLHPRLRSTVQVSRQHFRGQQWHVIQDHSNNMFFRLAEPAYRFIGLLDGKRTVGDAWRVANETLGDDAPTQGEVIQLLGQLYTGNLLQADVTADTQTLFARYKKRKQREITSYLMNIMFARVPILDPDNFLNKTLPLFGWIFSPIGFIVWIVLIGFGIHSMTSVSGWTQKLGEQQSGMLGPQNLILLYIAFTLIKACHEMGHAISCKKFGKQAGTGGEVHVIGIMFLVFTPVPYVDASSSWAVPNKWHRAIVGAAGMWVELAIASVAAIVWASSADSQHWIHNFAFNIMFVAGFSTIVFNANPLLRYDGYYIMSDLLEIPNLAQRGKEYVYYLVKKYIWNVRHARNPAHTRAEKGWLFFYAVASFIMRIFVTFSIMFYLSTVLNSTMLILATFMTIAGLITWVCVPTGKFIHYLVTNGELMRVRSRAILTSILFFGGILAMVGFYPMSDRSRTQGVVEPPATDLAGASLLSIQVNSMIKEVNLGRPATDPLGQRLGASVVDKGEVIVRTTQPQLEVELAQLKKELKQAEIALNEAFGSESSIRMEADVEVKRRLARVDAKEKELALLKVEAPISGILIAPTLEHRKFGYVHVDNDPQGPLGMVVDLRNLIIRAPAKNELAELLATEKASTVEIRPMGRPDILLTGDIFAFAVAGSNSLPHPSLGYQLGGDLETDAQDQNGLKTTENFFEVRINNLKMVKGPKHLMERFEKEGDISLLPGQRVVVRFEFQPKPLAVQGWKKLRQVFQKQFAL